MRHKSPSPSILSVRNHQKMYIIYFSTKIVLRKKVNVAQKQGLRTNKRYIPKKKKQNGNQEEKTKGQGNSVNAYRSIIFSLFQVFAQPLGNQLRLDGSFFLMLGADTRAIERQVFHWVGHNPIFWVESAFSVENTSEESWLYFNCVMDGEW